VTRELILILGGARSGKSALARELAVKIGGGVVFVATAEAGDPEMVARIESHKATRTPDWRTIEAPMLVGKALGALDGDPRVVLIDCLTLLASNRIGALREPIELREAEELLHEEALGLLEAYRSSEATWIVVSNEVGMGLVPAHPLGRAYRDALGRMNQEMARAADRVIMMVAGVPMQVKG
jgi:adenosylcobinamide kinase/adenosylcobinamide-phosphate guanylyltransferase